MGYRSLFRRRKFRCRLTMLQTAKRPFSSLSSTAYQDGEQLQHEELPVSTEAWVLHITSRSHGALRKSIQTACHVPKRAQTHAGLNWAWCWQGVCLFVGTLYRKPRIKIDSNALLMLKLGGVSLRWLNRSLKWEGCFTLHPLLPIWSGSEEQPGRAGSSSAPPQYLTRGTTPSSVAVTGTGPHWRSSHGNQSGQQLSGQGSSRLCCQLYHWNGKTWCLKMEIPPKNLTTLQQCKRDEVFTLTFKPGMVVELSC